MKPPSFWWVWNVWKAGKEPPKFNLELGGYGGLACWRRRRTCAWEAQSGPILTGGRPAADLGRKRLKKRSEIGQKRPGWRPGWRPGLKPGRVAKSGHGSGRLHEEDDMMSSSRHACVSTLQNDVVFLGDVAATRWLAGILQFAPLISPLISESSIFSRILHFSPYFSKMTKMPLNSSIFLKHLFKPLKSLFYPRNEYKR